MMFNVMLFGIASPTARSSKVHKSCTNISSETKRLHLHPLM